MLFEALFSTLRITRQAGFKPWSVEGSALVRLILSAARKSREASGLKLRRKHVLQTVQRLANTKKGRERIAHALDVSTIDAWMVQENLKRVVEDLQLVLAEHACQERTGNGDGDPGGKGCKHGHSLT